MVEPMKTVFVSSCTGALSLSMGPASLWTAFDSPVSMDSFDSSSLASTSLASAGTMSPIETRIMSPATSSRASISTAWPPRRTLAVIDTYLRSSSSAFSERYSCTNPSTAFTSRIARMMVASVCSPRKNAAAVAPMRMYIRGFWNCEMKIPRGVFLSWASISFGPRLASRSFASFWLRPASVVE